MSRSTQNMLIEKSIQRDYEQIQTAKDEKLRAAQNRAYMKFGIDVNSFDGKRASKQARQVVKSFFYAINIIGPEQSADDLRQRIYSLYKSEFFDIWESKTSLGKKKKISESFSPSLQKSHGMPN